MFEITDDRGTVVTVSHECGDTAERDSYVEGWQHFLGGLAEVLTP